MKHYGIIGNPLSHSNSAKYFAEKFSRCGIDAEYRMYENSSLKDVMSVVVGLDGFNVTIPYKEAIIPYLTKMSDAASSIGAVNVVKNGCGYNTDYIGFIGSIRPYLDATKKRSLVLGTGGASKAIVYGLGQLGITSQIVSRDKSRGMLYSSITRDIIEESDIIVQATPVGMWPKMDECPDIPYRYLTSKHLLFDCVYNPEMTLFLKRGIENGAQVISGKRMFEIQAEESWKIWSTNV